MRYISEKEVTELKVKEETMIEWVDSALRIKSESLLPAKISLTHKEGVFFNTMPCLIPSEGIMGVKVVNRYPERNPTIDGELLLYELESGKLNAIMDAKAITLMRTGAVAAHSINLFAKEGYSIISWIGLGEVARQTALNLLASNPGKKYTFKIMIYKNQHKEFENFIKSQNKDNEVNIVCVSTVEELMSNTDVIVSAVSYVENDFVNFKVLPEGVLVVPIHTRGFVNSDFKFDKVFGDDIDHLKHFKYFSKYKSFNEVSEVIKNPEKGRTSDKQKIIVYNIGIALHDIYFANKLFLELNRIDK